MKTFKVAEDKEVDAKETGGVPNREFGELSFPPTETEVKTDPIKCCRAFKALDTGVTNC